MSYESPIHFKRKPYFVVYKDLHTGELKRIKRRPPPKNHAALPTDMVELTTKRGTNWEKGEEFEVKHIGYRTPNTLQLKDDEGNTTFVSSFEVKLTKEVAYRGPKTAKQKRMGAYLTWP